MCVFLLVYACTCMFARWRCQILWNWLENLWIAQFGYWELTLHPLQGHCIILTTEPSPQDRMAILCHIFNYKEFMGEKNNFSSLFWGKNTLKSLWILQQTSSYTSQSFHYGKAQWKMNIFVVVDFSTIMYPSEILCEAIRICQKLSVVGSMRLHWKPLWDIIGHSTDHENMVAGNF